MGETSKTSAELATELTIAYAEKISGYAGTTLEEIRNSISETWVFLFKTIHDKGTPEVKKAKS